MKYTNRAHALACMFCSVLALAFYITKLPDTLRLASIIPQFTVLLSSAIGAVISILTQKYPDGTQCCTASYIMEDQVVWCVMLFFYMVTILRVVRIR